VSFFFFGKKFGQIVVVIFFLKLFPLEFEMNQNEKFGRM